MKKKNKTKKPEAGEKRGAVWRRRGKLEKGRVKAGAAASLKCSTGLETTIPITPRQEARMPFLQISRAKRCWEDEFPATTSLLQSQGGR